MTKNYVEKARFDVGPKTSDEAVQKWIDEQSIFPSSRIIIQVEEEDGIGLWVWHVHHKVLAEPLTEPLPTRQTYVKENKMDDVETRLKWMTFVKGPLPEGLDEQWKKTFGNENPGSSSKQLISLDLIKLHAKEHPGCPWDGEDLLSKKVGK